MGDPYRYQVPVVPRLRTWWAGGIAYASFAITGLCWIATVVAGAQRETWGMIAAQIAVVPTGFAIGCFLVARGTRYAKSAAVSVLAPLGAGALVAFAASLALFVFFSTVWRML